MSKKARKKWLPLFMLLLLILLLLLVYSTVKKQKAEREAEKASALQEKTETLLQVDTNEAKELHYVGRDKDITLVKEGDTWKLKEDRDITLNQTYITNMVGVFSSITTERTVAKNQEKASEFGLSTPELTVELMLSDDTVVSYQVGSKVATSDGGYYAMVLGNDGIYVVEDKLYSAFQYSEKELLEEDTEE